MNRKQHPIDDLFRQNLTDLEISPTEPGRSGFLKVAEQELKKRSGRLTRKIAMWSAIIVLLVGGIFMVSQLTKNTTKRESKEIIAKSTDTKSKIYRDLTETRTVVTNPFNNKISTSSGTSSFQIDKNNIPVKKEFEKRNGYTVITKEQKNSLKSTNILSERSASGNNVMMSPIIPGSILELGVPNLDTVKRVEMNVSTTYITAENSDNLVQPAEVKVYPAKDTIRLFAEEKGSLKAQPLKRTFHLQKSWNFNAGIYYTPEWIFNALDKNKYVNNFGLETTFRFGPYSIRTGAGFSVTRGYHEIAIESKSYLGSYKELQYITYQWDSRHYYLIPTIHTTLKDVYDTATHYDSYYLTKQYTYLQVPLILGYDFFNNSRWSVGFRIGPVMSLLIRSRVLSGSFDPGKDLVVSINDVTPDRIALNWQAMGGINAAFHFSRHFIFELEPTIRYYFDSVYEKKGSSEKPWSMGFHSAFLIDF